MDFMGQNVYIVLIVVTHKPGMSGVVCIGVCHNTVNHRKIVYVLFTCWNDTFVIKQLSRAYNNPIAIEFMPVISR